MNAHRRSHFLFQSVLLNFHFLSAASHITPLTPSLLDYNHLFLLITQYLTLQRRRWLFYGPRVFSFSSRPLLFFIWPNLLSCYHTWLFCHHAITQLFICPPCTLFFSVGTPRRFKIYWLKIIWFWNNKPTSCNIIFAFENRVWDQNTSWEKKFWHAMDFADSLDGKICRMHTFNDACKKKDEFFATAFF